jgi:hypothetical protein
LEVLVCASANHITEPAATLADGEVAGGDELKREGGADSETRSAIANPAIAADSTAT